MKRIGIVAAITLGAVMGGGTTSAQENHFKTVTYTPAPIPLFEETKGRLPSPIFDENPLYVRMYW
ncbi:MAG: hypothetical protein WBG01_10890 [Bacteroidota bacterium]